MRYCRTQYNSREKNLRMNTSRYNQDGLVSIMVASVLMVIMALLTLGFARVVQNEQRQALDNQLSRQAYYAAESGINIAQSSPGFPGSVAKTDCDVSGYGDGTGKVNQNEDDVVFSCIQIDPTPPSLVFDNDSITPNTTKVVPIRTDEYPATITFEWRSSDDSLGGDNCTAVSNLDFETNAANWGKIPPVRFELIGIPNTSFGREDLIANQFSLLLYPCDTNGNSSIDYISGTGAGNVGEIYPVTCTNSGDYNCQLTITAVIGNMREFYARFNSLYDDINVRITATTIAGGDAKFANAQAVVDSTGRANDVFRRLQARVPLYDTYVLPSGLQSLDDICKLYTVTPSGVTDGCNP